MSDEANGSVAQGEVAIADDDRQVPKAKSHKVLVVLIGIIVLLISALVVWRVAMYLGDRGDDISVEQPEEPVGNVPSVEHPFQQIKDSYSESMRFFDDGDVTAGAEVMQRAVEEARGSGDSQELAFALLNQAAFYFIAEDWTLFVESAEAVIKTDTTNQFGYKTTAFAYLAEYFNQIGDVDGERAILERAIDQLDEESVQSRGFGERLAEINNA